MTNLGNFHFDGDGADGKLEMTFQNSSRTDDKVVTFTNGSPLGIDARFTVRQGESRRFRNIRFTVTDPSIFEFTVRNAGGGGGNTGNGGITNDTASQPNQAYSSHSTQLP